MAVRTSGSGNYLRRTANLPSSAAFTICGWSYLSVDRNDYSALCSVYTGSGGSSNELILTTDANGTELIIWNANAGSQVNSGFNLSVGVPFFFALTGTAGACTGYYRPAGTNSFSSFAHSGATFSPTTLDVGNDTYVEWFNGRFWNIKCWDRALSADELLVESFYHAVKFPTSLNFHWKLRAANDTTDYSGNGRGPTVGGTLTSEDDAWQPWKPGARVVTPAVSGGISGSAAITLGALTASGAGTVALAGSASVTFGALTLAAAGTVDLTGAAAITLGPLTANGTGAVDLAGAAAITLGAATVAATGGSETTGAAAVTLGDATVAAISAVDLAGTAAITLADLTLTAAGAVDLTGAAAITFGALTASAAGALDLTGAAAITLDDVTLTADGALVSGLIGSAAITLGDATLSAAGALDLTGAAAITLAPLTLSAAGAVALTGSATLTLDDLTIVAVGGATERTGAAAITLDDAALVATGGEAAEQPVTGGGGAPAGRNDHWAAHERRQHAARQAAQPAAPPPVAAAAAPGRTPYVPLRGALRELVRPSLPRGPQPVAAIVNEANERAARLAEAQTQVQAAIAEQAAGVAELQALQAELAALEQARLDAIAVALLVAAVQ